MIQLQFPAGIPILTNLFSPRSELNRYTLLIIVAISALASPISAQDAVQLKTSQSNKLQFNRDIRPILSDRCFQCHGPDEKKREADLRFDLEEEATRDLGGYFAIVPGAAHQSELVERINSDDESIQMPPPESGKSLTAGERKILEQWIQQGASFEKHWSFQKIKRPKTEFETDSEWTQNEIDRFVLRKLKEHRLSPSPMANRATLARRLYLDLIGLPPSPAEIRQFELNTSPNAYEQLVDQLLASKHFGERMGRRWLDLARYADSNGYANDGLRSIWPYRDWVINAINQDMPFDQFTIEQLAGDLLPNPTTEQLIATGFHRNTPHQTEGGSDPEQYRVERTKNRTDTTGSVWLGLTVGCAQCHTHKFDPITHQDYYQLYAFFNNADEPNLDLPLSPESEQQIAAIKKNLAEVNEKISSHRSTEKKDADKIESWDKLNFTEVKSLGGATLTLKKDQSILASGKNPLQDRYLLKAKLDHPIQTIRLETLTDPSLPKNGPGRAGNGNFVLAELKVTSNGKTIGIANAIADHSQQGYSVIDSFDGDTSTGWAINVSGGNLNQNRTAQFLLEKPVEGDIALELVTYQQGSGYNIGRFRITGSSKRGLPNQLAVTQLQQQKKQLEAQLNRLNRARPRTMIMRERAQPRSSFVQLRGDFLDPGPDVKPNTPAILPGMSSVDSQKATRMDLAKWLVSPQNPLTPRVQVNRIWQHLFGTGLVETENDFGYQGSLPSHPELLDYLATELVAGGWKTKRLYKMIVMSATYRQASKFRPEVYEVDPKNRLLARQNRFRVEGEIIRDAGLATSGLLSKKMGGPSVFPPIPPNVIGTSSANHRWPTSTGEDRYRRGIYTAIYRANVYPMLLSFDGPDRDNACTRRSISNTPLQALTIANDAAFMEMAIHFGTRLAKLKDNVVLDTYPKRTVNDRIAYGFLTAMGRQPSESETKLIREYFDERLQFYRANEKTAKQFGPDVDAEHATWIAVARVLFNLDEFITRE